jgi:hypothetical protein
LTFAKGVQKPPYDGEGETLNIPVRKSLMDSPPYTLSSRPKRTRISCHAVLDMAACAAFRKESRMKFANATKLDRKSGVA